MRYMNAFLLLVLVGSKPVLREINSVFREERRRLEEECKTVRLGKMVREGGSQPGSWNHGWGFACASYIEISSRRKRWFQISRVSLFCS